MLHWREGVIKCLWPGLCLLFRSASPLFSPNFPPNGVSVPPSQLEGDSPVCSQGLGFTSALKASLESFPLPVYLNPIRETLRLHGGTEVASHLIAAFILQGSDWPDHLTLLPLIGISCLISPEVYSSHSVLLDSQRFGVFWASFCSLSQSTVAFWL